MISPNILVIGSDVQLLATRALVLGRAGYNVENIVTPQDAYRRVSHNNFDMLILCHSIPEKDRPKLAERINALRPKPPVIALYESTSDGIAADAIFNPLDGPELLLRCIADLFKDKDKDKAQRARAPSAGLRAA